MRKPEIRMLWMSGIILIAQFYSCAAPKGMVLKTGKNPKLDNSESLLLFTITTHDKTPELRFMDYKMGLLYIIPEKKPPFRFDVILEKKIQLTSPVGRACLVSLELPPGKYRMQKLIANGLSFQVDLGEISFSVPEDSTIYLGNINLDYIKDVRTPNGVFSTDITVNDMFKRDLALFESEYNGALNSLKIHNGVQYITGNRSFKQVINGFSPL